MAVPPPSKPTLRRALRLARERFAPSPALVARLMPLADAPGILAGYVAHRGEPDVSAVLLAAIACGGTAALPRIDGEGAMAFVGWGGEWPLRPGGHGIGEPAAGVAVVPDTLLVPLLGFDRAGRRLGQGGGHYDRWFAAWPAARRIGVAWSVQEADALPEDPWDVRLHAIVTEQEWIAP